MLAEAPDAATATLAAHRQGTRVEIADQRTENRTVWANPSGANTAELTILPTRVKRGTGWVPVDTTLKPRADGSVAPAATMVDLTLSGGGSDAPLVRLVKDGKAFALHWPAALPKPLLAGNQATYPEALPGVDLVIKAELSGYQQLLVVKNPDAARNPALASAGFRLVAEGLRVSVDDSGSVRANDDSAAPNSAKHKPYPYST